MSQREFQQFGVRKLVAQGPLQAPALHR
jgi:hypothetical protein